MKRKNWKRRATPNMQEDIRVGTKVALALMAGPRYTRDL